MYEWRTEAARRMGIEPLVLALLVATIFAVSMGSSSVVSAQHVGHWLRWVLLFCLAVAAVPYGASNLRVVPRWFVGAVAAFVGFALLSSLWSVVPRTTFEKGISFSFLWVGLLFLVAGVVRSQESIERLFIALLVAAALVAVAGLVVLVVNHDEAVQLAAAKMPTRYRGFGQNPNTSSMLFALALPAALWLVLRRRSPRVVAGACFAVVLLYVSTMASESRGALLASAAVTVVCIAVALGSRIDLRRLAVVELVAIAALFGTFEVSSQRPSLAPPPTAVPLLPTSTTATATPRFVTTPVATAHRGGTTKPVGKEGGGKGGGGSSGSGQGAGGQASGGSAGNGHGGTTTTTRPAPPPPLPNRSLAPTSSLHAELMPVAPSGVPLPFVPRQDEIGYPTLYRYKPIYASGSGRVFAWLYTIRQATQRPLTGFGFGTEQRVFTDRFYFFQGNFAENSYVGMFLQGGVLGLLLLLGIPFAVIVTCVRRRAWPDPIVAVPLAILAGGLVVGGFQSYMYSVGNVATLTFWLGVTLAAVLLGRRGNPA